jgi:orotidine-5'-phosphate decarboxylase
MAAMNRAMGIPVYVVSLFAVGRARMDTKIDRYRSILAGMNRIPSHPSIHELKHAEVTGSPNATRPKQASVAVCSRSIYQQQQTVAGRPLARSYYSA